MDDYKHDGKWVGNANLDENCTNPEILYESIVTKPEDIFDYIRYVYFDGSEVYDIDTYKSSKISSYVDYFRGRCYMFNPTEEMIKTGIKMIELQLRQSSYIYFHSKGLFKTKMYNIPRFYASSSKDISLDLDFTVYNMLDIGGKPCTAETGFDKDVCAESKLDKKSLETFGCTSPFGTNKDRICKDNETGSKVMKLYKETMTNNVDNCNHPCLFSSTKTTKTDEYGGYDATGNVVIYVKENIEVKEAFYLYSILSMIAEVGGYVGLFLGVSVNQVSLLVNVLLDKLEWIHNKRKRFLN